jgi:hypothetical protein
MKRILSFVAAAAAACATPAAFAATSGDIRGEFTVPYACSVVTPATQTMVVSGLNSVLDGAVISVEQNATTQYTLSDLAITDPIGASTTGSIKYLRADGTATLNADGITSGGGIDSSNEIVGVLSESGTVNFLQTETTSPVFLKGDYALETTFTCSEFVEG